MSRSTNVSASRRVTTPLIFIFSPLATVREPAVGVVACATAIAAEKASRKTASTREENIRNFGIAINTLSFFLGARLTQASLATLWFLTRIYFRKCARRV